MARSGDLRELAEALSIKRPPRFSPADNSMTASSANAGRPVTLWSGLPWPCFACTRVWFPHRAKQWLKFANDVQRRIAEVVHQ